MIEKINETCKGKVLIQLENINKIYKQGQENEIHVLRDINLTIEKGEFVTIVGESGSGKSTLMNMIGAIDKPSSGSYYYKGKNIMEYSEDELSLYRNKTIGFVFQSFYLMPYCNALKNVMLPLVYAKVKKKERERKAREMLQLVDMEDRLYHKPSQLSGGQKQRVAIARAIVNSPEIILADEPTGALDKKNSALIMELLIKLNQEQGITIVMITHSEEIAALGTKSIQIQDGILEKL